MDHSKMVRKMDELRSAIKSETARQGFAKWGDGRMAISNAAAQRRSGACAVGQPASDNLHTHEGSRLQRQTHTVRHVLRRIVSFFVVTGVSGKDTVPVQHGYSSW